MENPAESMKIELLKNMPYLNLFSDPNTYIDSEQELARIKVGKYIDWLIQEASDTPYEKCIEIYTDLLKRKEAFFPTSQEHQMKEVTRMFLRLGWELKTKQNVDYLFQYIINSIEGIGLLNINSSTLETVRNRIHKQIFEVLLVSANMHTKVNTIFLKEEIEIPRVFYDAQYSRRNLDPDLTPN